MKHIDQCCWGNSLEPVIHVFLSQFHYLLIHTATKIVEALNIHLTLCLKPSDQNSLVPSEDVDEYFFTRLYKEGAD